MRISDLSSDVCSSDLAEISFFGSVVHGIERVARSKGYSVLLFQSNEDPDCEEEGIDALLQSKVDGIIASVAKETTRYDHYLEVKQRNIPLEIGRASCRERVCMHV